MWRITKINNATHEVSLEHADGRSLDLVIPDSHNTSREGKLSFIQNRIDHENSLAAAPVASVVVAETPTPAARPDRKIRLIASIVTFAILLGLLLLKVK